MKDSGKRNGAVAAAQCSQMHISYQTETAGTDVDDAGAIYFQERSIAEAAELLDVPLGTVKSRTFYALRALRDALVARGFTLGPPPR